MNKSQEGVSAEAVQFQTVSDAPRKGASGMRHKHRIPASKIVHTTRGERPSNVHSRHVTVKFDPDAKSVPALNLIAYQLPNMFKHFEHDAFGICDLTTRLGTVIHNVSPELHVLDFSEDFILSGLSKLGHLLVAKKLSFSDAPERFTQYQEDYQLLRNFEFETITALRMLAEGFGTFEHDAQFYTIPEHPLEQFNHLAHAVLRKEDYNSMDGLKPIKFFVNAQMYKSRSLLISRLRRKIVQTCSNVEFVLEFNNDRRSTIKFPVLVDKEEYSKEYLDFIKLHSVNLPSDVEHLVNALIFLQNNTDELSRWTKQQILALNSILQPLGCLVVNYSNRELSSKLKVAYQDDIMPLMSAIRALFKTETVHTMEKTGRPWQLVTLSEDAGYTSINLSEADRDIAFLLKQRQEHVEKQVNVFRTDKIDREATICDFVRLITN